MQIIHDARPKVVDAPVTYIIRIGPVACRFLSFIDMRPISQSWTSSSSCDSDCIPCKINNHWWGIEYGVLDKAGCGTVIPGIVQMAATLARDNHVPNSIFCVLRYTIWTGPSIDKPEIRSEGLTIAVLSKAWPIGSMTGTTLCGCRWDISQISIGDWVPLRLSESCWTRIPGWSNSRVYRIYTAALRGTWKDLASAATNLVAPTTCERAPGSEADKPTHANHNHGRTLNLSGIVRKNYLLWASCRCTC